MKDEQIPLVSETENGVGNFDTKSSRSYEVLRLMSKETVTPEKLLNDINNVAEHCKPGEFAGLLTKYATAEQCVLLAATSVKEMTGEDLDTISTAQSMLLETNRALYQKYENGMTGLYSIADGPNHTVEDYARILGSIRARIQVGKDNGELDPMRQVILDMMVSEKNA